MGNNMINKYAASMVLTMLMLTAEHAKAALVVDTGTPTGGTVNSLLLDGSNSYAGQVNFSLASQINTISSYLDDLGNGGGSFSVSLYSDNSNKVGNQLYSASATFGSVGWNAASNLNWAVDSGNYWVAIEVTDGLSNFVAPLGAPTLLTHTAYNDGTYLANSGYKTYDGLSFGLQVDAAVAAVPEPGEWTLMLAGFALLGFVANRRKQNLGNNIVIY
jgi:hypothetical protein